MKLLILTQIVDIGHDNLGFFHDWIIEFSKQCEEVTVVCLKEGKYDFPENVKVLSLGKEGNSRKSKRSKVQKAKSKFKFLFNFYKYIWQERKNYDNVFVHMNPEYVVLGGFFWRFWGKRIGLWYTHKSVNLKLKLAEKLTHVVFTASQESFRIESEKTKVVGHGIETEKFSQVESQKLKVKSNNSLFVEGAPDKGRDLVVKENDIFKIIAVGRIAPAKDLLTLIRAIDILCQDDRLKATIRVDIIGGTLLRIDEDYLSKLKRIVQDKNLIDNINFAGSIPSDERYEYFNSADVLAHMSKTGSLDKVFLEAMASGAIPVSCNDASQAILKDFGEGFVFDIGNYEMLARDIKGVFDMDLGERRAMGKKLREIVENEHGLHSLIEKIIKEIA